MNDAPNVIPPSAPARNLAWLKWTLLVLVLISPPFLVVAGITSYFRLSRDAKSLQTSLTRESGAGIGAWEKKFQLSVGPFTCFAARNALGFVDMKPEARAAVEAVHGCEVGVYRLKRGAGYLDHGTMLLGADKAMERRGWDRIVGVRKDHQLVAVYLPRGANDFDRMRACVAVVNEREMIIVSARANLAPLIKIAQAPDGCLGSKLKELLPPEF